MAKIQAGDIIETLDGQTFKTRTAFSNYFQEVNKRIEVGLKREGRACKSANATKTNNSVEPAN